MNVEPVLLQSPVELAGVTDMTVVGEVSDVVEGREIYVSEGSPFAAKYVTLVIEVESVLVDNTASGLRKGATIYVETEQSALASGPGDYMDAIPAESDFLLFLERTTNRETPGKVVNPDGGRPEPKTDELYEAWPQGFMSIRTDGALEGLYVGWTEQPEGWRQFEQFTPVEQALKERAFEIAAIYDVGLPSDESELSGEEYLGRLREWAQARAAEQGVSLEDFVRRAGYDLGTIDSAIASDHVDSLEDAFAVLQDARIESTEPTVNATADD